MAPCRGAVACHPAEEREGFCIRMEKSHEALDQGNDAIPFTVYQLTRLASCDRPKSVFKEEKFLLGLEGDSFTIINNRRSQLCRS